MAKTRKHHGTKKSRSKNLFKKINKTTKKVIPIVNTGLEKVGKTVKIAAVKSAPYVEKGISGVYGALATGFDMGVKGVQDVRKVISKKRKTKKHGKKYSKKH
jgi:hypothetical protein